MKPLGQAKTRLRDVPPTVRADLALAMAADTVAAALACPVVSVVVVVTDDDRAGGVLETLGAVVVPDVPAAGLNPALRYGAEVAAALAPSSGVACLAGDLAGLRPDELTRALLAAAVHPRAFVPDASGTGTTLLVAGSGTDVAPAYGADSRRRHRTAGWVELDVGEVAGLRRDVDTPTDIAAVRRLGAGRHTAVVLSRLDRCQSLE